MKTYNFKAGFSATQDELNYLQTKELLKLLKSLNVGSVEDITKMTIADLITMISDSDLVPAMMKVVLETDGLDSENLSQVDYRLLTISEITEVIEDFFTINPGLAKLFGTGSSVLSSIPTSVN